jgi:hypothetical protein
MDTHRILVLAATAAMTSCGVLGGSSGQSVEAEVAPQSRWQGTLNSPRNLTGAVALTGTVWMAPLPGSRGTHVSITIDNATPGGVHPWAVHIGRCGSDDGVFGTSSGLEPLEVDRDGEASASGTLTVRPTEGENYFVSVLAAPSNRDLVVACANLAPPIG